MSKIIFWIVVAFAVMFALRLIGMAKAKQRKKQTGDRPRTQPLTGAMVRCVRCGVFLPKTDALPAPGGFVCGDTRCAQGH